MSRTSRLIVLVILVCAALLVGYKDGSGITSTGTSENPPAPWADQEGLILGPNGGPPRGLAEDPIKHLPPPPGRSDSWYEQGDWTAVVSAEHGHFVVVPNDDGTHHTYFIRSFQDEEEGVWMTVTEAEVP